MGVSLFGFFDQKVVAMLAEIFMIRLEAAARALNETVPSSTSRFIPFTPIANSRSNNAQTGPWKLYAKSVLPVTFNSIRVGDAMGELQRAVARIAVAVVSIVGASVTTQAQQPPKADCRVVSKLEYNTAKKENVIISQGCRYLRTGPFWRRHYWHCLV